MLCYVKQWICTKWIKQKITFWITMEWHWKHVWHCHTGAKPILVHPKWVEAVCFSTKETYFNQRNSPDWCALWTAMLNMWIFVLETTMLHETCKKK